MSERLNRTSICTVIFINIVDHAQAPVDDQIALKERFNALISEAVKNVAQNDRIILDTGDGAALALLGAPEEALFVALDIRDRVAQEAEEQPERAFAVRLGINLGPVRVVNDLNGMLNVVGDGINAAQRVMSFAQPNQILVSRSYYEIASRLSAEISVMFAYYGVKTDKYVREHEVYVVRDSQSDAALPDAAPAPAWRGWGLLSAVPVYYWIALAVGAIVLALLWGLWISRSHTQAPTQAFPVAAGQENPAATTEDESGVAEAPASDVQQAAPAHKAKEKKTVARPVRRESKRDPLCSEAQRMLKQC